jgi:hypothetical protein
LDKVNSDKVNSVKGILYSLPFASGQYLFV